MSSVLFSISAETASPVIGDGKAAERSGVSKNTYKKAKNSTHASECCKFLFGEFTAREILAHTAGDVRTADMPYAIISWRTEERDERP